MSSECFSKMEIDAIGEILNISLGASATAVSTMLNARVDITTPVVNVVSKEEFHMGEVEPAVGVEITYVAGLEGKNVMLLKRHDVKVIVEMVMGMEIADEDFELDEINVSVVCEVMNQMMGSSATALSEFLGKMVNISTPISFEVANAQEFIDKYFTDNQPKVVVGFTLRIADRLESEFFNVMPMELAKGLVEGFLPEDAIIDISSMQEEAPAPAPAPEPASSGGGGGTLSQEEIEKMLAGGLGSEPEPAPAPAAPASSGGGGGTLSQEEIEKMLSGGLGSEPEPAPAPAAPAPMAAPAAPVPTAQPADMSAAMMQGGMAPAPQMMQAAVSPDVAMMQMQMMQQMMQQMQQMQQQMTEKAAEKAAAAEPKMIHVQSPAQQKLKADNGIVLEGVQEENMELIMSVPLEISVEIGRTRKLVKDILDFTKGSLVVLDKLAGEQVDLFVNGQCIARGDVVVVEDNFGIRITEIMKVNLAALE
ncbi:flagellar motor switch protein FliN [Schaedlerella arabinosiphila]|uniref:Flagellar motor switch protein FliN n=1 Tax=Schaedlerella arabinosiphila TaxID=2044587 RepID=A0A3R8JRT6_9FIRM|nr:flagellar motor switch protein FliN [Schaedlerella arabinosiphila]RRK33674.1 flagellar motor switch protein FliN [Schaedlerella arabinosiphila]